MNYSNQTISHCGSVFRLFLATWLIIVGVSVYAGNSEVILPDFKETRTVELTQTVKLSDIPADTGLVRLWVPIPSDRNWQRVLDITVEKAPGIWKIVPQAERRGDFIYVEWKDPGESHGEVVISCIVERQGVHFPLGEVEAHPQFQANLFEQTLDTSAPLMFVDEDVSQLAADAVGRETDKAVQALLLVRKVADFADHYSKDPSKPHCGRGSAQDCLVNGGGCCSDLHSLYIAMARSRGIASRMQYGYRLLDAKEGEEFDPGYRCWVEYFIPGAGWVPTDIVAADNADESNPYRWSSLGPYRVWLWEGRSFELTPPTSSGPVHTMLCGWAEIDGKAVDPLPGSDGSPARMTRTVSFRVLDHERDDDNAPKLPE
jgi:transglutaminase-like putative cysteine protease